MTVLPGRLPVGRQPSATRHGTDRGSATIWLLGLAALIIAIALASVLRASAVLARHRLERAADLSALAGAAAIGRSGADPCTAAARVAEENGAQLAGCSTDLDDSGRVGTVAVLLSRPAQLPLLGSYQLRARAKAGRLPAADR